MDSTNTVNTLRSRRTNDAVSSFVTMCFEGARVLVPKNLAAVFGEAVET